MSKRSVIRKILRQPVEGDGVDALIADVLSAPTGGEASLAKAIRESGADDSVEVTALAAKRALTAVVKAYRAAGRPVPSDVLDGLAGDSDDDDEDGPPAGDFTTYDARRQIEEEDAENKRNQKRKKRGAEEPAREPRSPFDALSKEDATSLLDAIRDVLPEWRADGIRKSHPELTREQAIAKAYEDPWLYGLTQRRQAAEIEKADAEYRDRAARADRELCGLVADIRKAEPGLSEPQAWKRALDQRPDLYVPTPTPRYDPADAVIAKAERDAAHARYERLAEELRKSDGSLSAAQAYARAMQLHPDWYAG